MRLPWLRRGDDDDASTLRPRDYPLPVELALADLTRPRDGNEPPQAISPLPDAPALEARDLSA